MTTTAFVQSVEPISYNRVPQVTWDFWAVKLLAVTVGETGADFLAQNMGLGLTNTTYLMSAVLMLILGVQFAQKRYVPWAYWIAVVFVSIVGTLITDVMVDNFEISLEASTIAFAAALAATFATWYAIEKTLSIHTIFTGRREAFYWLTILLTFALGTAAGDLLAEKIGLGYFTAAMVYSAVIAVIGLGYFAFKMNGILAFWLAYIFTRPMGASFGDYFSQPTDYGGLGFGTTITSLIFLVGIFATLLYMTSRHVDGVGSPAGSITH